jgi:hypothetical protein
VRIKFDELPPHALPRSSTARFSERWQKSLGDDGFLEQIVERWRLSGTSTGDNSYNMALMADALSINSAADTNASPAPAPQGEPRRETPPARGNAGTSTPGNGHPASRKDAMPPTYTPPAGHSARSASAASMMGDRVNAPGMSPAPARAPSEPPSSLRSLRERLTRPHG